MDQPYPRGEGEMRILVMGGGGLGSVVGAYLAEAGVDVTLVARSAHAEALRHGGLTVHGRRGTRIIRDNLHAVTHPREARGDFDYFILAVKSKDTESALRDADCIKNRCATVLSLQNNIVKEGILAEWAGAEKVLGASIIEGGTLVEPGVANNHATAAVTFYAGELDGTVSQRAEHLVEVMNEAELPAKAVTCIRQVLWEKLCQICNASAWSVSTLAANPALTFVDGAVFREGVEHYVTIAHEILSVYTSMGYTPQNFYAPLSLLRDLHEAASFEHACAVVMNMATHLKTQGNRSRTSMHDDVLRGRKTEAQWILKPFIEKSTEFALALPTLTGIYRALSVFDHYAQ
ncbi:MAG: ketopantoate reductase family protein [Paraburkholderia fungorum]|nr:MAG: ketopantoate reductase family protein [Paraburkholderia fungorum]